MYIFKTFITIVLLPLIYTQQFIYYNKHSLRIVFRILKCGLSVENEVLSEHAHNSDHSKTAILNFLQL